MSILFESTLRSLVRSARRAFLAFSCLVTGHQHNAFVYIWSALKKQSRNKTFNATGFEKFPLMSEQDWKAFSNVVDDQMLAMGALNESKVDWAENKRLYIDCGKAPISEYIARVHHSKEMRDLFDRIFGLDNWEIRETQIWRNYPERYSESTREINSTYWHVDNGPPARHRLLCNIFFYLSPVKHENGPFMFYDPAQSRTINRRFFGEVLRNGNLRSFDMIKKIENLIAPRELELDAGEAVLIDNQVCLHRAGFCFEGHRDIMEILVMQKN